MGKRKGTVASVENLGVRTVEDGREQGMATKSNVAGPKHCTRKSLAQAVRDEFKFDISPLWAWMQRENYLPKDLHGMWDPVWGTDGAWQHLRGRDSTRQSKQPMHWAGRFSRTGKALRPPCRCCGVSQVVLLCYYKLIAPIHARPHMWKLLELIESEIRGLRVMRRALAREVRSYRTSQTEYLKGVLENAAQREFDTRKRRRPEKNRELMEKLQYWAMNSKELAQLPMYSHLKVDSWFEDLEEVLRLVQNDVINPRLPVLEAIWPPRSGRPTKMIANVRTILRNDGFTWNEVTELVRDDADIDDPNGARDRARSQVRAAQSRWR
jgi:hypothetical protein